MLKKDEILKKQEVDDLTALIREVTEPPMLVGLDPDEILAKRTKINTTECSSCNEISKYYYLVGEIAEQIRAQGEQFVVIRRGDGFYRILDKYSGAYGGEWNIKAEIDAECARLNNERKEPCQLI